MFRALTKRRKQGQTVLEYVMVLIIVMAAFFAVSTYIKRGLQGRWKVAIDDLGDQYDPRFTNSFIRHTILSNGITTVSFVNSGNGFYTMREDATNSRERKQGFMTVGSN
jgi:hypothetical protein